MCLNTSSIGMLNDMQVKCNNCGYLLNVAGLYPRPADTRKCSGAVVPSDGHYEWGRYQCHGCGKTVTVPEIAREEKGVSR